jgi:hypothetical protein
MTHDEIINKADGAIHSLVVLQRHVKSDGYNRYVIVVDYDDPVKGRIVRVMVYDLDPAPYGMVEYKRVHQVWRMCDTFESFFDEVLEEKLNRGYTVSVNFPWYFQVVINEILAGRRSPNFAATDTFSEEAKYGEPGTDGTLIPAGIVGPAGVGPDIKLSPPSEWIIEPVNTEGVVYPDGIMESLEKSKIVQEIKHLNDIEKEKDRK